MNIRGLSFLAVAALAMLVSPVSGQAQDPEVTCISCHSEVTPGIVADWQASRHSDMGVSCDIWGAASFVTERSARN